MSLNKVFKDIYIKYLVIKTYLTILTRNFDGELLFIKNQIKLIHFIPFMLF